MPSAAQKQRRRKLKQKKETKKGRIRLWQDHQERVKAAVLAAFKGWSSSRQWSSPSERGHFEQFIPLLADAFQESAWDLPAHVPLDEEAVKAHMEDAIDDGTFTGDVQIEDIEQYAGFISLATAAYNAPEGTNAAPAPAAPPAPVAETAEELRRRARNLTKKLAQTAGLQSRVDAGLDPNAQQVGKLARRGELENELAAVTEALAALPPLESGSDDEATVPDSAASVPADSVPGRLVAAEADRHFREMGIRRDQAREAEAFLLREAARREPPRYEAEEPRERREEAVRRESERREWQEREANVGGSWVCTACTFENPDPTAIFCDICNTRRPVAVEDATACEGRRFAGQIIAEDAAARQLMAEDARIRALESARAVAVQRPSAPVPPPAPAVAAPPPAPPPAPAATQAALPEPPDALLCPIGMDLMRDPVLAMDGHTYERSEIERWLADHQTSPKTNAPLPSKMLVPNHSVKSMVQEYLDAAKKKG